VEILAYKDTWREGLDSFLSMIRARLVLLKELLAPTGSIYVHLDWHTAHYVKVLMDEIFGYENFRNQVVWQRTTAHNDPKQFGRIHDVLFWYVPNTGDYFYKPVRLDGYSSEQLARYRESDANGRFTGRDLTAPGIRYGETGEPWRGLNPTASGRHWSRPRPNLKNCYRKARSCSRRTELPGSMV
jgi:adenine-specific DNA-methyltransferase